MINLPTVLPSELVPLSWLLGVWEGTGVVEYAIGEQQIRQEFGQRVSFSHDGLPYLNYSSHTWMPEGGESADPLGGTPLVAETGYWRLARGFLEGDPGPGMLPGVGPRPYSTTESVETLRNNSDGFDVQVSLVHPTGVNELYLGQVRSGRIDLATDAVMRTEGAKEYSAATRIYGLVEGDLLWAWDIAALGQDLRTHASARLARVD
jgi:THAP4-like, heme-binding beta-barrel domain